MREMSAAMQHTRCVHAITCIDVCFDSEIIAISGRSALKRQIEKIFRWKDAAGETLKHKKLSAGAKRQLKKNFADMSQEIKGLWSADGETKFLTWTATVSAVEILVQDCRVICRHYASGNSWRYLHQTLGTLVRALEKCEPSLPERGLSLYEKIAPETGLFIL